ncbi:MAG: hypothetical protein IKJ43_00235 [Bacilli bacterium]|nr:hypothetical protein [Bacilli bacterium]
MSLESAKKSLGFFKVIYIIEGVLVGLLGVLFYANYNNADLTKISDSLVNTSSIKLPDGMSLAVFMGTLFVTIAILNFIEAWLFSRVIKDGSKSTLLMVLLTISAVSGVYTLFIGFNASNVVSLVLTLISLYAVYVVRKEA